MNATTNARNGDQRRIERTIMSGTHNNNLDRTGVCQQPVAYKIVRLFFSSFTYYIIIILTVNVRDKDNKYYIKIKMKKIFYLFYICDTRLIRFYVREMLVYFSIFFRMNGKLSLIDIPSKLYPLGRHHRRLPQTP